MKTLGWRRRARAVAALVMTAFAGPSAAQDTAHRHDATVHHRFEDAERWARVFDDPARDA